MRKAISLVALCLVVLSFSDAFARSSHNGTHHRYGSSHRTSHRTHKIK